VSKRRIIPKLLMKNRRIGNFSTLVLVTTTQFDQVIEIGDPVSQAKIFEAQAADELICLDLDAVESSRALVLDAIRKISKQIFMPITVGGGVRSVADFRELLRNGADKVTIGTAAVENPSLINEAASALGAQCVVLSIDYGRNAHGAYRVYTHRGKVETDWDPIDWAIEGERRGAGEILLTSIERDGGRQGLCTEVSARIAAKISVPLITAGGCGLASHFIQGFGEGKADAVAAGTFFCFQDQNLMQTRSHILNAGIPIRIIT